MSLQAGSTPPEVAHAPPPFGPSSNACDAQPVTTVVGFSVVRTDSLCTTAYRSKWAVLLLHFWLPPQGVS